MQPIEQSVRVTFRYPVHFTEGLFARGNLLLRNILCAEKADAPRKMLCVVDQGVLRHRSDLISSIEEYCRHHEKFFSLAGSPLVVEGGEETKNSRSSVQTVHRAVHAFGIDRHSYIVAVGGGAVIDMVGYAAATAHRGIRLVRVPTTVLSQNDSAVGVKNSVNAFGKKNFLGTFAPPYAVLNDLDFLRTLPKRDWLGGLSEAIKVALLKDTRFFGFIEDHAGDLVARDMEAMQYVIYRCAQLHLEHIAASGDAFEFGSSRPLDFGHWAAHKLEALSNYGLRHGEAVAIGLALDSTYSYLARLLPESDWRRIMDLISALHLPVYVPELDLYTDAGELRVLEGLDEFREHLGGELTIMLLRSIGTGLEVHDVDKRILAESIAVLEEYQTSLAGGERHEHTRWHLPPYAAAAG